MELNASSLIRHPLPEVYKAYRDELPDIAHFIPNVKEVRVLSREDRPGGVKLHNLWVGRGEIPKVAQGIIKPDMLNWDDYAEWDDGTTSCQWEIKIRVFTEKFSCRGQNRISAEGPGQSRVTLSGKLEIDLRDIPGVPRIFASRIAPQVEAFIIALIKPNLEQVNVALGKYLDSRR